MTRSSGGKNDDHFPYIKLNAMTFFGVKNSHGPSFFSTCQKLVWRWPELAMGVVLISCSVPSWLSGPSSSPPLGRAVVSSCHCQHMEPKGLHAKSRPMANPPIVHSTQKRAHQKRSNTRAIKNDENRAQTIKNDETLSKTITQNPTRREGHQNDQNSAFLHHGQFAGTSPATKLLSRGQPLA